MRVQFTFVGNAGRHEDIWLEMDVIPREGDVVAVPGVSQADTRVRTVVWYLFGEDPDESENPDANTPFVYVVLGSARRDFTDDFPRHPQRAGDERGI